MGVSAGDAVGELISLGYPKHVSASGEQAGGGRRSGCSRSGLRQVCRVACTYGEARNLEQILYGDRLSSERTYAAPATSGLPNNRQMDRSTVTRNPWPDPGCTPFEQVDDLGDVEVDRHAEVGVGQCAILPIPTLE